MDRFDEDLVTYHPERVLLAIRRRLVGSSVSASGPFRRGYQISASDPSTVVPFRSRCQISGTVSDGAHTQRGDLKKQVKKVWDFDRPYRHPGTELGTSTQIGMSLGVALAHKGKGRVVVDIQPDGDLMFDAGALWIAAKYEIPMLVVMHNNRAYYNDWEHQIRMARQRGTDEAKAHIGMDLFGPEPDFGALARSMGCYGEGPIDNPKDIRPALERALAEVKKGRLALVDTITQHR